MNYQHPPAQLPRLYSQTTKPISIMTQIAVAVRLFFFTTALGILDTNFTREVRIWVRTVGCQLVSAFEGGLYSIGIWRSFKRTANTRKHVLGSPQVGRGCHEIVPILVSFLRGRNVRCRQRLRHALNPDTSWGDVR